MKNLKKILPATVKILVTIALICLVFKKIGFSPVWDMIRSANTALLFAALVAFIISQWLSSLRLLNYFGAYGYRLSPRSNHILYLIGMFYNFFIPGGIGGDAYKVYLLNKHLKWEVRKLTLAVLNDRLSGLIAVLVLLQLLFPGILPGYLKLIIPVSLTLTFLISFIALVKGFPVFKKIYFKGLAYSLGVQGFQLLCVFFILKSLGTTENAIPYFAAFLGSSLLSVLSFSGIGVREWLFMKASEMFMFSAETSVSTALVFSFLTALVSLFGIFFQFRGVRLRVAE